MYEYIYIHTYIFIYIYTVSSSNPMGSKFWFFPTPGGKVKHDILSKSHKISQNEALLLWSIYFVLEYADDKPLSFGSLNKRAVSITCPQKNWNKKKRFVSGDFMRFCQNVIFNFSTRSKKNQKIGTIGF